MKQNKGFYKINCLRLLFILLILGSHELIIAQEEMLQAKLEVEFVEEEDGKLIQVTATDSEGTPVPELELFFYVKRTFSLLPVGGNFNMTDEEGFLEIMFPDDLPGNETGNLDIVIKLMDNDLYEDQTLEFSKEWGVPVDLDEKEIKRSLWAASANAPIPLIIIVNSLLFVVYFIIIYIIYQLFRISRIKAS